MAGTLKLLTPIVFPGKNLLLIGELVGITTYMYSILKFIGLGLPFILIHSIINSIVIVMILSTMVMVILLRTVYRDISRYNEFNDEDGAHEEFGWKMVHADVFRPPNHRMILCVLLGNGSQILGMVCVTLCIFLFFDDSLCTLGLIVSF
jgi:hypothetical protein